MDVRRRGGLSRFGLAAVAVIASTAVGCDNGDGDEPAPSFTEVNERVFQPSCVFSSCHETTSAAGQLDLEGDAHQAIVDVPSMQMPSMPRVVPGDSAGSYLLLKIVTAMPDQGTQMPPTQPLDDERSELVRAWIDAGAAND